MIGALMVWLWSTLDASPFAGGDVDKLAHFVSSTINAPVVVGSSDAVLAFELSLPDRPQQDDTEAVRKWQATVSHRVTTSSKSRFIEDERKVTPSDAPFVFAQKFAWFKGVTSEGAYISELALKRTTGFDVRNLTVRGETVALSTPSHAMGLWHLPKLFPTKKVEVHWLLSSQVVGLSFKSMAVDEFLRAIALAIGGDLEVTAEVIKLDLDPNKFREQWVAKLQAGSPSLKSKMTAPLVEIWSTMLKSLSPTALKTAMSEHSKFTLIDVTAPDTKNMGDEFVRDFLDGKLIDARSDAERRSILNHLSELRTQVDLKRGYKGWLFSSGRLDFLMPMAMSPNTWFPFTTTDHGLD